MFYNSKIIGAECKANAGTVLLRELNLYQSIK